MGFIFQFDWNEHWRNTFLCPCLDCWSRHSSSETSHSPLPESWERLFAPCKCSFINDSTCEFEESYLDSDGVRRRKHCPLGNVRPCRLRILYINHVTGESTLRCPCTTCCPDRKGNPCLTLASLFGEDKPALSGEATSSDPLIPVQDLTRVGKPCWRLGDLFDEHTTESLDLDDDPIIPAQDVGLDIFDDMPGFALARNHLDLTARDPPLISKAQDPPLSPTTPKDTPSSSPASTCTSRIHPRQRDWTFKNILPSLTTTTATTRFSRKSLRSFLTSSYTDTAQSPPSTDDHPRLSSSSVSDMTAVVGGLILSVLLVVVYECVDIYVYLKSLPAPPRFLCRVVGLVIVPAVVGGLCCLRGW